MLKQMREFIKFKESGKLEDSENRKSISCTRIDYLQPGRWFSKVLHIESLITRSKIIYISKENSLNENSLKETH